MVLSIRKRKKEKEKEREKNNKKSKRNECNTNTFQLFLRYVNVSKRHVNKNVKEETMERKLTVSIDIVCLIPGTVKVLRYSLLSIYLRSATR
jgi:hypothetical protein